MLKMILILLLKIVLLFIGLVILYLFAAFTFPYITVNKKHKDPEQGIKMFILSNGVHTDIVVPVKSVYKDWTVSFPLDSFDVKDDEHTYIGFGWGDKGFYLYTPEWSDLTASTAINAVCGLGGTAMHVTYLKERTKNSGKCEVFTLSEEQYKKLIVFIEKSFEEKDNTFIKISHSGYAQLDRFYEAKGKYSLFKTCNNWTNRGLKEIGIKTGLWTPFSAGLMRSVRH